MDVETSVCEDMDWIELAQAGSSGDFFSVTKFPVQIRKFSFVIAERLLVSQDGSCYMDWLSYFS
jgi:hypothetical protein